VPTTAAVAFRPEGITAAARTALMRLEYKFLAHISLLPDIRAALRPWVRLDGFSAVRPDRQYTVRSIYYDTRRFHCYQEKFDGFRLKKKLRIRGYDAPGADSTVFLEIKYKQGDFIGKHRAPLRWDGIGRVFADHGSGRAGLPFAAGTKEADAAGRFLYNYYRRRMLPVVLIAYEREAFYSRFDSTLRLTLDKNVRSRLYPTLDSLYVDRDAQFVTPDQFVFEVKFYGCLPRWVNSLLTRFDLERLAVSKYGMGIDCQRREKKFQLGVGHTVEFPDPMEGDNPWKH
jgi:hypothetical protein